MFKENKNGDLIGYHVEGGETFELSMFPPLSLKTLVDDRPLFLGYDSQSWFPMHLNVENYKVLEITFSKPKCLMIDNIEEYSDLIIVRGFEPPEHNGEITVTTLSDKGKKLYKEGYRLFCLTNHVTSTGQADLLEAFLMDSSKYVKSIKEGSLISDILNTEYTGD